MTEVVKWVTAVLAIWGAVSILVAVFWGLIGRRIFRKPPTPMRLLGNTDPSAVSWTAATNITEFKPTNRMNGGA